MSYSDINSNINSPLFSNTAKPQITLNDIAACKGESRGYLARLGSQLSTLWYKGTFITDDHVKDVILEGDKGLIHDLFSRKDNIAPLSETHKVMIEDLSDIIAKTARTMLEKMEVPLHDMVPVNDLRDLAEKVKPPATYRKLMPDASDYLYATANSIKGLFYRYAGKLMGLWNSSSGHYYAFRAKRYFHHSNLASRVDNLVLFKNSLVGFGINAVQKVKEEEIPNIIAEKEALREQLTKQVMAIDPHTKVQNQPLEHLVMTGICVGTMVDLAERYFALGETERTGGALINLIAFEKGGSLRAEINQAAYETKTFFTHTTMLKTFREVLDSAKSQTATTLARVLSSISEEHINELQKYLNLGFITRLLNNSSLIDRFLQKDSKSLLFHGNPQQNKGEMMYVIARVAKYYPKDIYADYFLLQQALIKEVDILFREEFTKEGADKDYLLKRREQVIGEIKVFIAMEEYSHKKPVSDPLLAHIFKSLDPNLKEKALARVRGMDLVSCTPDMGTHFNYVDDAAYLDNLKNLKQGFYGIFLKTQKAAHAVSLVINPDGSMHVLDPNIGTFYFKNSEEAQKGLVDLLSLYPGPESNLPNRPYHRLEFFRLELLQPTENK